jgi:glycine/D-amino acid oxidase-like deaminating enzyme
MWQATLPDSERFTDGATSIGDKRDVDVVIVGGGYTGLWTAWHLTRHDPALRIAVVEREHVGFGASGRNGGWCSALLPMSLTELADRHGAGAAHRMQAAMHETVREIGEFCAEHVPPDVYHRGGTLDIARSRPQVDRLRDHLDGYRSHGFGDEDYRWLDGPETIDRVAMTGAIGALATPHCASVHPLRLAHALARAVRGAGVTIVEGVEVQRIEPGRILTDAGPINAEIVVRATEGYTCELPGQRRAMLPIYSLMIATEPLADDQWASIGLADRATFADGRHQIIYGQRTIDGRLAFGGRGAPYHWGSAINPSFDTDERVRELLVASLFELFPSISGTPITHHWGGPLGLARDWHCAVTFDRSTGLATAGGYVGDGVATTNLAGRTLADLIVGSNSEIVALPWVGHRSRRWEPEPLRWAGVNHGRRAAAMADRAEARTERPSRVWGTALKTLQRH